MRYSDMTREIGDKLAPKLVRLITDTIIATQSRMRDIKHHIIMRAFHVMSDEIASEAQMILGPTLEKMLADPDLHPDMRPHIEFLAHTQGQLSAMAGTALSASGILSSIAMVMNNRLMPTVSSMLASDPNLPPDPNTLAAITAKRIKINKDNVSWMAGQGIDGDFAAEMIEAQRQYPPPADLLEMLRRNLVTLPQVAVALERNAIPDGYLDAYMLMRDVPLSPADLALAVLRGNMPHAEAVKVAGESGVSAADFDKLVANTGEPPGLMQLLEGYRRGFIDKATLEKGILQSRYRNEWIPLLEQLRYSPMSISDAVRAVVQGHISEADGRMYASQNGLDPAMFSILVATDGNPLSRTDMESLYNRGLVTKAQVDQASLESRLKNKYTNMAFELHTRLLEPRQLGTMVVNGVLTESQAVAKALEHGFSKEDATAMIQEAVAAKTQTYRNREMASVELLYENNAIPASDVIDMAKQLGYSDTEIVAIVNAAEFRREEKALATAISAARTKFLGHHLTTEQVKAYLTSAGVPDAQSATMIELWTIEQSAYVRTLTEAQVIHAMKKQIISPEQANQKLLDMGYSTEDAAILIEGA